MTIVLKYAVMYGTEIQKQLSNSSRRRSEELDEMVLRPMHGTRSRRSAPELFRWDEKDGKSSAPIWDRSVRHSDMGSVIIAHCDQNFAAAWKGGHGKIAYRPEVVRKQWLISTAS